MVEKRNEAGKNVVDFVIPLSGSRLFDMTTYATAINLCARFPGLSYTYEENKQIHLHGALDDASYASFKAAAFFEAGNFLTHQQVSQ